MGEENRPNKSKGIKIPKKLKVSVAIFFVLICCTCNITYGII